MSVLTSQKLVLEENADGCFFQDANIYGNPVVLYYLLGGTAFNLTGYTAQMMVRKDINDLNPLITYVPTLGGVAGTVAFYFTAAQVNTLIGLLPQLKGIYDVLLTSGTGGKTRFIPASQLEIIRAVSR